MRPLIACLLLMMGCTSSSPVEIEIANHTSFPVVGVLEAGILNTQVTLWPHQTQKFTIYREIMPDHVRFILLDKSK